MNSVSNTMRDAMTMLRRQVVHTIRYPVILMIAGIPVILLLLFVYVFGGTMGAGLAGGTGGRGVYLAYVLPGILLMTVAMGAQGTAISVSMDMTQGIVARFRTMAISRGAVLSGHVAISMIQQGIGVALVVGAALLIGFRSTTGPIQWLGAVGVLAMVALAVTWLSVACGLVTNSVEMASNLPMPLMLLPFLGSGFVPTATLPVAMRWFAEYQPFTPIIETLRGLLVGTPIGASAWVAMAWCLAITAVGYLWSVRLYGRERPS